VLVVTDPRYPQEISYIQRYSMICGQIWFSGLGWLHWNQSNDQGANWV
jgi:hypothetical protein